jgi:beta-N-acetylhexosaminidase
LLIGSFAGGEIPVEMKAVAREFDLGGITIFTRLGNIETPEQVAGLAFDIRNLGVEMPAWVGIDQEGGRVARLRSPFTEWPPMAMLGRSDDPGLAARFARALGSELAAVGVSLDYAPVLDILTNPKNPVIGDRALAETSSSRSCSRLALQRAASISPDTEIRRPTPISSCRLSSTPRIGFGPSSSCRSRQPSRRVSRSS